MAKKKESQKTPGFVELGETGKSLFSNTIGDEFITDLSGSRGIRTYKQMSMNDPIISAALFYFRMFIKSAKWDEIPASADPLDELAAEFLSECMEDMSYSMDSLMNNICTFFTYGWSNIEHTWKMRDGKDSKYDDGMVGIKKLSLLPQNTCAGWEVDEHNTIKGMYQYTKLSDKRLIPITKTLLFRTTDEGNVPTGRSLLRGAYTSWYYSSHLRELEAIKVERDTTGMPVIYAPPEVVLGEGGYAAKKTELIKLLTNLRVDEQMGVLLPNAPDGSVGYKLELLSSPGNYAFDIGTIIERYDTRIAQSMASDFIMLGHRAVGSFALARSNRGGSELARLGFLDSITDVLNIHLIPRLMKANPKFSALKRYPRFKYTVAKIPALDEIARMINALAKANVDLEGRDEVVNYFLKEMGAPIIPEIKDRECLT